MFTFACLVGDCTAGLSAVRLSFPYPFICLPLSARRPSSLVPRPPLGASRFFLISAYRLAGASCHTCFSFIVDTVPCAAPPHFFIIFSLSHEFSLDKPRARCYNSKAQTGRWCPGSFLGVAQLVARYLGVVEAAGSNPVTQTISSIHKGFDFMNTRFFILIRFYVRSRVSLLLFVKPFSARLNTQSRRPFGYRRRYSVCGIPRVSLHTLQSDNKLRFSAFGFYLCPLFRKHQCGR